MQSGMNHTSTRKTNLAFVADYSSSLTSFISWMSDLDICKTERRLQSEYQPIQKARKSAWNSAEHHRGMLVCEVASHGVTAIVHVKCVLLDSAFIYVRNNCAGFQETIIGGPFPVSVSIHMEACAVKISP